MKLPDGASFVDKDGKRRASARIRWWVDPTRADLTELSMEPLTRSTRTTPCRTRSKDATSMVKARPFFFGHYWLKGKPQLLRRNVCCLACYRFDGEHQLDATKLVWVNAL